VKKVFVALVFIYASTLFGAYEIKLGVYKNTKNLQLNIEKIKSTKYKKYISIRRKNNLNYVHAIIDGNKKEAERALKIYKTIFKDAFISHRKVVQIKKVQKKVSLKASSIVSLTTPPQIPEIVKVKHFNAQKLLKNKTIYLCYETDVTHSQKRIMEMKFSEGTLKYRSLLHDFTPIDVVYHFDNESIYLEISGIDFKHRIDDVNENSLYLTSFINGKKAHRLRYYFTLKDAKKYMRNL